MLHGVGFEPPTAAAHVAVAARRGGQGVLGACGLITECMPNPGLACGLSHASIVDADANDNWAAGACAHRPAG
jgi:hypothetical protein